MFCTTLCRRSCFAAAILSLQATNGLALRESKLNTHDLILPLNLTVDPKSGQTIATRHIRFLLLSPTSVADDTKLDNTLQRVQHFASLTGGQDLAIVFLLSPPKGTTFVTARALTSAATEQGSNNDDGVKGLHAFAKLQALLSSRTEIPYVPILPLSTLSGLSDLLKRFITNLTRPPPAPAHQPPTNFNLLQLCTAAPTGRMPAQTAFVLSDIFPDFASLATACTAEDASTPGPSSPSQRAASARGLGVTATQIEQDLAMSDELPPGVGEHSGAEEKLQELRALVGEQEYRDLIEYWREEWTVD